jgi:hypothetical protein
MYSLKYPSYSSFNFCINNPIVYKDVDGKDIVIRIGYETAYSSTNIEGSNTTISFIVYTKPILILKTDIDMVYYVNSSNLPEGVVDALISIDKPYEISAPLNTNTLNSLPVDPDVDAEGFSLNAIAIAAGGFTLGVDFVRINNSTSLNEVGDWNAYFWVGIGNGLMAGAGISMLALKYNENFNGEPLTSDAFVGISYATNYGAFFLSISKITSYGENYNTYIDPDNYLGLGKNKLYYHGTSSGASAGFLLPSSIKLGYSITGVIAFKMTTDQPLVEGYIEDPNKDALGNPLPPKPIVASSQYYE